MAPAAAAEPPSREDLLRCPVCLERFQDPHLLGDCGHTFCKRCLDGVLGSAGAPRCPTCRRPFQPGGVLPNFALRHLLQEQAMGQRPAAAAGAPGGASQAAAAATEEGWGACMAEIGRDVSGSPVSPEALMGLGLPAGLARLVSEEDRQIALRVFLLDNSGSTSHADGQLLEDAGGGQMHFRRCTRWEEIVHMALRHAEWNARLGTPCEFVLLNPFFAGAAMEEGIDFQRVDASRGSVAQQLGALRGLLDRAGPKGATPLAARLRQLRERIQLEGRELAARGQKVVLVIATDGLPTDRYGAGGLAQQQALVQELRRLSADLPVHLVVRLCTDDDAVVGFYNEVDEEVELQLEVVDDIRGEAREARRAGNRWLTYSPMIHQLREGGTFLRVLDLLDERRLEPVEVCLLCQLLLRQAPGDAPLPSDPKAFCREVALRLPRLPLVYDPLLGGLAPPVCPDEVEWAVLPKGHLHRQCGECLAPSPPCGQM